MKRVFSLCAMLSLLVGCSKDFEEQTMQQSVGGVTTSDLPAAISASMPESENESRTYVEGDRDILWHNGDAIAYFATTKKAKYCYNGVDGVADASFDLVDESDISRIKYTNAVYPYDAATDCTSVGDNEQLSVVYPAVQTYAANSFGRGANLMVARGTILDGRDESLAFRNACGYLTIKLYSSKIKPAAIRSIKLTALGGEKIAGPATIIAHSNAAPEITMSSEGVSEVTLNCGSDGVVIGNDIERPTEFWFALPPTTFNSGIRIEVVDVEGTKYIKKTDKKIVVERNKIKPMAAFKFAYPTDNQLWYSRHSSSREPMKFYSNTPFDAEINKHYYDEDNKHFVIEFDAPLTVIKETAFKSLSMTTYSRDLATVALPEKLTTIEEDAFYSAGITEIVIPGNVTHIDKDAFMLCDRLRSVFFYPSPTNTPLEMEITTAGGDDGGPFSFNGVIDLAYIYVDRNIVLTKGGELFTPDDPDEGIFAYSGGTTTTVVIGAQMPEIHPYMFSSCSIDNIEIPAHITKIGEGAFTYCDKLTSIVLPNTIKSIGEGAFSRCKKLASITIPASVKSIGTDAFYENESLRSVIIEDSYEPLQLGNAYGGELGTIQRGAFYYSPLSNIYLGRNIDYRDGDEPFTPNTWDEGVFANKHYDVTDLKTTVTISVRVTEILEWMFSGVRMEEVTIPASVQSIKYRAFYDCRRLDEVRCERNSPPTLGEDVFDSCDDFGTIYVPASAESSYENAENWSDYAGYIVGY